MNPAPVSRRNFLKTTSATGSLFSASLFVAPLQAQNRSANAQIRIGLIGTGWRPDINRRGRGVALGHHINRTEGGELAALCDVDQIALDYADKTLTQGKAALYDDYRDILQRDDIDAVVIATPDHWHAKITIEAMNSGKDVYCEKPATVTINEGRLMSKATEETGRILQVGTQQRTECGLRFAKAVAMVRDGRIGRLQRIKIGVDPGETGGPFDTRQPPSHFNWDRWLGPAPETAYIPERSHWTFRWWFEYAGGKLTDWGAHHVDIAHWAMHQLHGGPSYVEGTGEFQMKYQDGYPTRDDMYNTPSTFEIRCRFPEDVQLTIDSGRNGITFEGTEGRFFVNRGQLAGKPVDELKQKPLPQGAIEDLYEGDVPKSHMDNFFQCVRTRQQPVSDIESHHRSITTCHLANLALRLNRPLQWNTDEELLVGDNQANTFLSREYRDGYQIES